MNRWLRSVLAPLVLVITGGLAVLAPAPHDAARAACETPPISTDPAGWNVFLDTWDGRAWGQVFLAPDTLIRAVTFWRYVYPDTILMLDHTFFLTRADSTGRPLFLQVIRFGPTRVIPYGDDGIPGKLHFEFDPPLVLPELGMFYVGLKDGSCGGAFSLKGDSLNPYPQGEAWQLRDDGYCDRPGFDPEPSFPSADMCLTIEFCEAVTGVASPSWEKLSLAQNRPNPFAVTTTIDFELPAAARVRLEVFDLQGRRVARLADRKFPAGSHGMRWDGRGASGERVAPGMYVYRLIAGGHELTKRMVLFAPTPK